MSKHTIIATSEDGQASDTCMVYVQGEIPLESFSVEPKDILWDINDGQVYDLRSKFKFNYYPMNASCASSTVSYTHLPDQKIFLPYRYRSRPSHS